MIHTVLAAGNDDLTGWDVAGLAVLVAGVIAWCWLISRD